MVEDNNGSPSSIRRTQKACKAFAIIMRVGIVLSAIIWIAIIVSMASPLLGVGPFENSDVSLVGIFMYACHCIILLLLLIIFHNVFSETAKGKPPFASIQVERLRMVSALLLVLFALEAAISIFEPNMFFNHGGAEISSAAASSAVTIDMAPLIAAAVVYAFSFVFEYGVLLQEDSDEVI